METARRSPEANHLWRTCPTWHNGVAFPVSLRLNVCLMHRPVMYVIALRFVYRREFRRDWRILH
jgi:hypothetical protein